MKILHFSLDFSQGRPLISNFTTMAIVKLCCHNFTQSAYFMIFFASSISYRPTDLSLLKEFSKNFSFSNSYKLPFQSAIQKISMSTNRAVERQLLIAANKIQACQDAMYQVVSGDNRVCGNRSYFLKSYFDVKLKWINNDWKRDL